MKIALVGFSKTGNVFMFMDYIKEHIGKCDDFRYIINEEENVDLDLSPYDLIILGTNTWGEGKIPNNCKQMVIRNATNTKKEWIIFGTGNSIFPKYCKAVDSLALILSQCDNKVISTFKYEQRFDVEELEHHEYQNIKNIINYCNKEA